MCLYLRLQVVQAAGTAATNVRAAMPHEPAHEGQCRSFVTTISGYPVKRIKASRLFV